MGAITFQISDRQLLVNNSISSAEKHIISWLCDLLTLASFTALQEDELLAQIQPLSEPSITFYVDDDLIISIPTDDYLDLIDGDISRFDTEGYSIRRRIGTRPIAYEEDNTKLFSLYFDVFNQKGQRIKTKIHNQPKPE